jgi:hypothetical protein
MFFISGSKPFEHKGITIQRLPWLLRGLLDTMTDGSVLVARHDGSQVFLQFVKRTTPSGMVLGFGYPDAPWSEPFFAPLSKALDEASIAYSIAETGDATVPRFLEVELSPERLEDSMLVARVCLRVMCIDDSATFTCTLEGDLDVAKATDQIASARGGGVGRGRRRSSASGR